MFWQRWRLEFGGHMAPWSAVQTDRIAVVGILHLTGTRISYSRLILKK